MHVLLVEDEQRIATYLKRALTEQGHVVESAFSGQAALDWLEVTPFDLIILDIMLPEVDGIVVCRTLRKQGVRTPVLMLTARDTVDDRVLGLDAGADDYLIKPFAIKELLARCRALLRRGVSTPRQTTMQVADLVVDTLTRRVKRGEVEIELTAKEYMILECLLHEADHVLSRAQIADHVWSYDTYYESNVVDVYIRNLRRKLDTPFATKLIHTVRGVGYRLSAEGGGE